VVDGFAERVRAEAGAGAWIHKSVGLRAKKSVRRMPGCLLAWLACSALL
jgi:hypothetical protein